MGSVYKNPYTLTCYAHIKAENTFLVSWYNKKYSLTYESGGVCKK